MLEPMGPISIARRAMVGTEMYASSRNRASDTLVATPPRSLLDRVGRDLERRRPRVDREERAERRDRVRARRRAEDHEERADDERTDAPGELRSDVRHTSSTVACCGSDRRSSTGRGGRQRRQSFGFGSPPVSSTDGSAGAVVSYRLGGDDGVSVEARKWAWALGELGFAVRRVAGAFEDDGSPDDAVVAGLTIDDTGAGRPAGSG